MGINSYYSNERKGLNRCAFDCLCAMHVNYLLLLSWPIDKTLINHTMTS